MPDVRHRGHRRNRLAARHDRGPSIVITLQRKAPHGMETTTGSAGPTTIVPLSWPRRSSTFARGLPLRVAHRRLLVWPP